MWPQGKQARRFSSVKHRAQRFDDDEVSTRFFAEPLFFPSMISFFSRVVISNSFELASVVTDSDDVDISASVPLDEFVKDDVAAACSRATISVRILK
jgi:hypothetical protein